MKTLLMKSNKIVETEEKVLFVESTIVPGWMNGGTCKICNWGLHEDKESPTITATRTGDGRVMFFHNECFNLATDMNNDGSE